MDTEVAVVGGGIVGLSVACSLLELGVDRVTLLEREPALGQGSTSRANGGVRAQFTTAINVSFSAYSIAAFEELDSTSSGAVAFRQEGYLLFTGDPARAEVLRRAREVQRSLGVDTEWLEPDQIVAIAPFVRADGLVGGTFHARDGFLDPHGVLSLFARRARALGAEIRTSSEVLRVEAFGDAYEIETADGRLRTSKVVDAAGPAAASIAALVGVDLPIHPVRRNMAYVHDDREPRHLIPMCVDLDTGVLVRREGLDGYLIAYSDPADPPGWDTTFDPTWIDAVAARIGHRFPHLVDVAIDRRHCWAGLYPETPDGHAIVDEIAAVPGFFICGGFGGHGLMHAPAAGRAVAELVVEGTCTTFDLHPLRSSRFAEGDLVREQAVL
ncbi:MAG: FAD-binding oxidoreductase [Actinomycetota bacterium]|nr:FAD-binding oxidoreductase [Actinomycetota bacterium]